VLKVKGGDIALNGKPISELQNVTCCMGSHSVTGHTTLVNVPYLNQPDRLVLDLPTQEGWKAELTKVAGYIPRWFTCSQAVTHCSTNLARHRV